jgi:hypothetical protein
MKNLNYDEIKKDKQLLEKLVLAYWYSIPHDTKTPPETLEIDKDNFETYNVKYIRNGITYGYGCILKVNIDRYVQDLNENRLNEAIDVFLNKTKDL